jgi:cullin 1
MSFIFLNSSSAHSSDQDPKNYVDSLLEIHTKNALTVSNAFKGEPGFVAALDKACREFVNRNKCTGQNTSKSPELLARYSDGLLRKSNKAGEEDDLEKDLISTVRFFSLSVQSRS